MFGLFKKDSKKQLQKEYEDYLLLAMQAQRNGNIKEYSRLIELAEEVRKRIKEI